MRCRLAYRGTFGQIIDLNRAAALETIDFHLKLIPVAHAGRPLVIHNNGRGRREEDELTAYPITGRFRWALEQ